MPRTEPEDVRRRQLIEATINTIAEEGFMATTLGQIARRAGVSQGLVAHYFGDKERLLEATLRALIARLSNNATRLLSNACDPRARLQAIIDAALAIEEFDKRTCTVWLAFWSQVLHATRLRRVQVVYQRRMLANLRHAFKDLIVAAEVDRVALTTAALIDGLWIRATLSEADEINSPMARALVSAFVDGEIATNRQRVRAGGRVGDGIPSPPQPKGPDQILDHIGGQSRDQSHPNLESTGLETINPATGSPAPRRVARTSSARG